MAEYIKIEDVTYGYGFIYVWDSVQKKVLKYSENGDFLDSYKFDYTAYSLCCINENLLSFAVIILQTIHYIRIRNIQA